jgi:hypothetical protein
MIIHGVGPRILHFETELLVISSCSYHYNSHYPKERNACRSLFWSQGFKGRWKRNEYMKQIEAENKGTVRKKKILKIA